MIILSSSRETALRNFISRIYADAATRMFGAHGLVIILNDEEMRDVRNKAAHDEVLRREEAQQTRTWAMKLLGNEALGPSVASHKCKQHTGEENRNDHCGDFTTGKDT